MMKRHIVQHFMWAFTDMDRECNGAVVEFLIDLRPRGCGFEPHQRLCICVLKQDTLILASILVQPRKTRPDITEKLLTGT